MKLRPSSFTTQRGMNMKKTIKKSKAKGKICDSCCSKDPLSLGAGPGRFRDFDSDYSYGIAVCPFCGGMGRVINSKKFKAKTKRIWDLRDKYCPLVSNFSAIPAAARLQILEEMISEIKDLFEIYGSKNDVCFAKEVSEGALDLLVEDTRNKVKKQIQITIEESRNASPEKVASHMALIIAMQGGLKEADEIFRVLAKTFPASSIIAHDYAMFQLTYFQKRFAYMLPLFEKATKLRPLRASHFYDLAQCLMELEKYDKALEVLQKAGICSDNSKDLTDALQFKIESEMR